MQRRQLLVGPVGDGASVVQDLQSPKRRVAPDECCRVGLALAIANVDGRGAILADLVDHAAAAIDNGDGERLFIGAGGFHYCVDGTARLVQAHGQLRDHGCKPIACKPMCARPSSRMVVLPLMAMPPTTLPLLLTVRPPWSVV